MRPSKTSEGRNLFVLSGHRRTPRYGKARMHSVLYNKADRGVRRAATPACRSRPAPRDGRAVRPASVYYGTNRSRLLAATWLCDGRTAGPVSPAVRDKTKWKNKQTNKNDQSVWNDGVTAQALHEKSQEELLEKVTLQAATVDRQRWSGGDMMRQTAPNTGNSDRKRSVADSRQLQAKVAQTRVHNNLPTRH